MLNTSCSDSPRSMLRHILLLLIHPLPPAAGRTKTKRKQNLKSKLSILLSFCLAVGGGFEPPVQLPVRQFSKLVVSATHPSHQTDSFFLTGLQIYKEFIVLQLFGADFVIFKVEYVTFPEQITLTKPSHKESVKTLCDGSLFRYFSSENGTVTH